jgi:hypothetical protein
MGIQSSNNNNVLIQNNHIHFTSAITTVATFLGGMQVSGNNSIVEMNDVDGLTSLNATSFLCISNFGISNIFRKNKLHGITPLTAGTTLLSGFQFSGSGNTRFYDNEIYDFAASSPASFVIGLNFAGNGTAVDVTNVTSNKIYNLSSTSTSNIRAMSCFPRPLNTVNINNNVVTLTDPNASAAAIFGILIGGSGAATIIYEANVLNNTVKIGGSKVGGTLGAVNSYGILRANDNVASVYRQKHNVSINERTTGDANTQLQIASWVGNISGTLDIDSNSYYATDTLGGVAGGWIDTLYTNQGLAGYKAYANPHEQNTVFMNQSHLTVILNMESCPNPNTLTVELRAATSPYAVVESVNGIGGGNMKGTFIFSNAVNGTPYYIVVKSANSIETWSASTVTFTNSYALYNFTTSLAAAYGSNQKLSGGIPSVYQGDANQDGFVNLTDVNLVYNDGAAFQTSPSTDFNCDGVTDVTDVILASNNNNAFVQKVTPPVLAPSSTPVVTRTAERTRVMLTGNNGTDLNVNSSVNTEAEGVGRFDR